MMEWLERQLPAVLIGIGVFLLWFYGVYIKNREEGRGFDTAGKRIAFYGAMGIGAMFIGGGILLLIFVDWGRY
ncbi:MAG: hypothetical protein CMJ49_08900 [Planctomycetaceae bacterium]|nr:hypothetical protein [Planctomycetaceae bacterium]